jgi:oxygen-independent coproporphyrinogen-3 oxidase
MTAAYSIYLHIPFCTHRCAYCDFNTYAGQEHSIPAYVEALCREIEFVGRQAREKPRVHTIFFGGGTPSLLSPRQFGMILRALSTHFELDQPEATLEANPGTVTLDGLSELRRLGINRISLGVQSANAEELHMLERAHDFFDVIEAVSSTRKAGFDNLNLDLIYGLPGQSLHTWQTTVKRAVDLNPEHISAYALTLEHGTPFGRWSARGFLAIPDPDLAAEMYEWAGDFLEINGYRQYEISNWTKPGRECRHNLQYWQTLPYLGLGAGGHGYANGFRYSNALRIKTYIDRTSDTTRTDLSFPLTPATVNHHRQSIKDDLSEFMIMGLRLTDIGVTDAAFRQRFGSRLMEVFSEEITALVRLGLLEWVNKSPLREGERRVDNGETLRLTPRGRLLGNQVFMRFVG